ncbi:hypothetical protein [Lysobacter gummosus]|uniref:hypothetical protein n=1 Tax=Lysobacter gummosus TaxID=262324 RepID=UPI003641576F
MPRWRAVETPPRLPATCVPFDSNRRGGREPRPQWRSCARRERFFDANRRTQGSFPGLLRVLISHARSVDEMSGNRGASPGQGRGHRKTVTSS